MRTAISVSEYAKHHMAADDLEELESVLPSTVSESDEKSLVDHQYLLILDNDGSTVHPDMLIII